MALPKPPKVLLIFSILTLILLHTLNNLGKDSTTKLAPESCRMSYMSPSYILHTVPSAPAHYTLSLYREVGWQPTAPSGLPVLFIPGNAGSSHQVRSLASSAARQFYPSPYTESADLSNAGILPLDFWALDHAGDLSAFHGPTLNAEIDFAFKAATYVLDRYPADTPLVVVGHSMGGIVGASLLRSSLSHRVSLLLTLSTPHLVPPARSDAALEPIYNAHLQTLTNASLTTPILSLCGGAPDGMVPSETCVLPPPPIEGTFRHTVFGTSLDSAWTGASHQVSLWCDQLRTPLARALLNAAPLSNATQRADVLTYAFVSARDRMSPRTLDPSARDAKYLPPGTPLVLDKPEKNRAYMLPLPFTPSTLILFLWSGSMRAIGPKKRDSAVTAWAHVCRQADLGSQVCTFLEPPEGGVRLIPDVAPSLRSLSKGKQLVFPVPGEGVSDDNGIALFESPVPLFAEDTRPTWAAIEVEGTDSKGAILAAFASSNPVVVDGRGLGWMGKRRRVRVHLDEVRTEVNVHGVWDDARVVYRVEPVYARGAAKCEAARIPPLLMHCSRLTNETTFHPLTPRSPPALLHSHTTGPFIPRLTPHTFTPSTPSSPSSSYDYATFSDPPRVINFTIYASADTAECRLLAVDFTVDFGASVGRNVVRYWPAVTSFAAGVAGIIFASAWRAHERGEPLPPVTHSLVLYTRRTLPLLIPLSAAISVVPLPRNFWLGGAQAFVAPILVVVSSGLVVLSWGVLSVAMGLIRMIPRRPSTDPPEEINDNLSTYTSHVVPLLLVAFLVPRQIGFLAVWALLLYTASAPPPPPALSYAPTTAEYTNGHGSNGDAHLRLPESEEAFDGSEEVDEEIEREKIPPPPELRSSYTSPSPTQSLTAHLLLLATWLLPTSAPILAIYTRSLLSALTALVFSGSWAGVRGFLGGITPLVGDHAVVEVWIWLAVVERAGRKAGLRRELFTTPLSPHWIMAHLPLVAASLCFILGPRKSFIVPDVWTIFLSFALVLRAGVMSRIWGPARD